MISTYLVEHRWLTTTALLLLLVAGPFAGAWLVTRPRVAWFLAGLSLAPVALLTLSPMPGRWVSGCYVDWSLPTLGRVEVMANLVLFVVPVLLVAVASRRPAAALLGGSALSAGIELFQGTTATLGRSCDTTDWVANSLGSVLGAVLAVAALQMAALAAKDGERVPVLL